MMAMEQVCWNAGVIPIERRRLWGGVQNVKFTNMSDLGVNSSLAQQSPTVQQLLRVSQHAATRVMMIFCAIGWIAFMGECAGAE